jgi:hypothetical protein
MLKAPDWNQLPKSLRYLRPWAAKYGIRGLTVYFGKRPPLAKWASKDELVELRTAYDTIAQRGDADAITAWCLSIKSSDPANEVKEHLRGLLLLFERLAEYELPPFADGEVRYVAPEPPAFDWSVLPSHLDAWKPWLKKFEAMRTEWELYEYVQQADASQLRELRELKDLIDRDGEVMRNWCDSSNVTGNPAEREAF